MQEIHPETVPWDIGNRMSLIFISLFSFWRRKKHRYHTRRHLHRIRFFSLNIMGVRRPTGRDIWRWMLHLILIQWVNLSSIHQDTEVGHWSIDHMHRVQACHWSTDSAASIYSACHCACAVSYWFHWFRMQRERQIYFLQTLFWTLYTLDTPSSLFLGSISI